jgi:hypothetical protein
MGLVLGFAATFVVGLASGVMLLSGEATTPAAPPSISLAARPIPPAAPVTEGGVQAPAPAAVSQVEPAPPPAAPAPAPAPAPVLAVSQPAPEPPQPAPVAAAAAASFGGADPGEPMEVASASLPLPPTVPKAPVQKMAAKPPERIDRACTQAVFRFQQGLPLSPAEQAHVRNGCATRR